MKGPLHKCGRIDFHDGRCLMILVHFLRFINEEYASSRPVPAGCMRSGCWWRGVGKWSMKAGSVTNLPPSRAQSGRPMPCRSCDSHGDFSSVAVWCRPESQFVPSTSSCCSITGFRESRRTFICDKPQYAGWGRFDACHCQAGRSRGKHWCTETSSTLR